LKLVKKFDSFWLCEPFRVQAPHLQWAQDFLVF
jgi:hypothetical protein